jgi:hypothetical protein
MERDSPEDEPNRRQFLRTVGAAGLASGALATGAAASGPCGPGGCTITTCCGKMQDVNTALIGSVYLTNESNQQQQRTISMIHKQRLSDDYEIGLEQKRVTLQPNESRRVQLFYNRPDHGYPDDGVALLRFYDPDMGRFRRTGAIQYL